MKIKEIRESLDEAIDEITNDAKEFFSESYKDDRVLIGTVNTIIGATFWGALGLVVGESINYDYSQIYGVCDPARFTTDGFLTGIGIYTGGLIGMSTAYHSTIKEAGKEIWTKFKDKYFLE
jgi:hypothetical protein